MINRLDKFFLSPRVKSSYRISAEKNIYFLSEKQKLFIKTSYSRYHVNKMLKFVWVMFHSLLTVYNAQMNVVIYPQCLLVLWMACVSHAVYTFSITYTVHIANRVILLACFMFIHQFIFLMMSRYDFMVSPIGPSKTRKASCLYTIANVNFVNQKNIWFSFGSCVSHFNKIKTNWCSFIQPKHFKYWT